MELIHSRAALERARNSAAEAGIKLEGVQAIIEQLDALVEGLGG